MTIRALIEAVERGTCPLRLLADAGFSGDKTHQSVIIRQAFNGSLDAALALHEALLPGWEWTLDAGDGASVENRGNFGWTYSADASVGNIASAWLLAILRAVEAEGQA